MPCTRRGKDGIRGVEVEECTGQSCKFLRLGCQEFQGTETVEGLVLKLQRNSRVRFNTDSFKEMKKLRLLQLDCVDFTGDYGYLSKELRWICWQGFTFNYIPDDFYQENIVAIDLKRSNIKQVWKEPKMLEKLKILNLSHSRYLKNTPDFSNLPNIEKLIMKDCPSLSEVHPSIGDLENLLLINLKDCVSLSNLPRKIYQLKSLKILILSGCSKIDKLEKDIVQMESLTTLIAKGTAVKEVPYSIATSKSIGYISLCGYERLSRDIFPSLIWSWMSPTMKSLPQIHPFEGVSLSSVSLDVESNNLGLGYLPSMICSLSKHRSVHIQCHSETQLTRELRRFLDDLYDANFTELETSHASQIPDLSLRSLLIEMGSCAIIIDTLNKSIVQIYKRDTVMTFNDEDWKGVISYLGIGDNVEIFVAFGHGVTVKQIAVYLIYGQLNTMKNGPSTTMEVEPSLDVNVQPSPEEEVQLSPNVKWESSLEEELHPSANVKTNVKMELSLDEEVQPSTTVKPDSLPEEEVHTPPNVKMEPSLIVKKEPLPKPNKKSLQDLQKE